MTDTPTRIQVTGLDDYLAAMTRIVFQSGLGRNVVDAKWEGFTAAFDGFDCERVAELTPDDVDRLVGDQRIIRNRRKIEATVRNASKLLDLDGDGGFPAWLRSHADDRARERAIRREFSFLGPAGIHEFLWTVGEPVGGGCER